MYILKFKDTKAIKSWIQVNTFYVDSFIDSIKDKTNLNINRENIVKYLETANLLDLGLCVDYATRIPIETFKNPFPHKVTLSMSSYNEYNFFDRLELINTVCKDCINYTCCKFSF